jgi:nucleoid-associated protein YgaU
VGQAKALRGSLRNAHFHVVAPGDSLWSIAKRMLGPNASVARIARQVDRLWSLNQDRIATGDPDLLMVGTQLTLR